MCTSLCKCVPQWDTRHEGELMFVYLEGSVSMEWFDCVFLVDVLAKYLLHSSSGHWFVRMCETFLCGISHYYIVFTELINIRATKRWKDEKKSWQNILGACNGNRRVSTMVKARLAQWLSPSRLTHTTRTSCWSWSAKDGNGSKESRFRIAWGATHTRV